MAEQLTDPMSLRLDTRDLERASKLASETPLGVAPVLRALVRIGLYHAERKPTLLLSPPMPRKRSR